MHQRVPSQTKTLLIILLCTLTHTPVATSYHPVAASFQNSYNLPSLSHHQGRAREKETAMSSSVENQQKAGSFSSSWRRFNANNSSSSSHSLHVHDKKHKLEDSDEDMFTVPDVEAMQPDDNPISTSTVTNNNATSSKNDPAETGISGKRRRGRNPVDKECRRLKRLLRNRVSAQQARERKKVYVNDLESRAKELEDANSNLEEKISTLVNENTMLRKVLMNTRPKVDDSIEQK